MKIALCGVSSTGKTTLAKTLLENPIFRNSVNNFISVDGRQLLDLMGCKRMDNMNRHQTKEYQIKYFKNKLISEANQSQFITDRSYIDIAAYWLVRDTFDTSESEQNILLKPCKMLSKKYDIHFYLPFGLIEFERDGYRPENNTFNKKIDNQINQFLDKWQITHCKINVVEISKRVEIVLNAIKNFSITK